MRYPLTKTWKSLIQAKKHPLFTTSKQISQPLKQPSTVITALLLAAGFGLSVVIPASATGTATQATPPHQKTQRLIQPGWEKEAPNEAIVTRSVVALVTRAGNPKKIRTWADLAKPGISTITPNPKTSGGAMWNFLGLWGSITQTGGDENKALQFVTQVFKNVPVLPKDAREATDTFFKQKQGDVLITYENEVILAAQKGETGSFSVIPQSNISIDNPVAVVDKNVDKHGTRQVAEAFVKYLFTPEAQREFTKAGFRPVDSTVEKEVESQFPKVKTLFTVKDLGGWDKIQKQFFDDGAVFDKIQAGK